MAFFPLLRVENGTRFSEFADSEFKHKKVQPTYLPLIFGERLNNSVETGEQLKIQYAAVFKPE